MHSISRRTVLAGGAAAIAAPAIGARAANIDVDVVVIGAGAAGIAAARRLAAAKARFVVIEASDHVGGRCVTDTKAFDVPFDRGAHWIHRPQTHELVRLEREPLRPRGERRVHDRYSAVADRRAEMKPA